jgi:hypothetical protein
MRARSGLFLPIPLGKIACPVPKRVANATTTVSNPARINRHAWLVFPLLALAFVVVTAALRVRRVEYVSGLAGRPASAPSDPAPGRGSPWQPRLIIPGQHAESFEWLDQTRQMFALREWRVRHVDYENALSGREVYASCPYRWWLGLVALGHHVFTGAGAGPSVEWSALYADPLLLLVFGAATVAFAARRFGAWSAALMSVALATLFPLGAEFLPGVPDDHALIEVCTVWSILPLLAGACAQGAQARRRWFLAGGIAGGVAMWVSVPRQLPILFGIALGGFLAALATRARPGAEPGGERANLPWRAWGFAGAATCLGAYLLEYFPRHMGSWELRAIHPIFGVAWLGGAELLARTTERIGGERRKWSLRAAAAWVIGAAALASLPAAMWIGHNPGLLAIELPTMRLSLLPESASAANLWAWLLQNGLTLQVQATLIPLLVVIPAVLLVFLKRMGAATRVPVAIALGPVLAAAVLGIRQISWWNGADSAVLALMAATAAPLAFKPAPRWVAGLAAAFAAAVLLPGAFQLWPSWEVHTNQGLSETEVVGLVERDLAYALAKHVGSAGAVVLAPPELTSALYYYGGLKGLATYGWEDLAGFQSAVRISSATTPEEAQELVGVHGVTDILIPTWDPFMDAFAQIGEGQVAGTFLERLHQWNLPRWLTPVPYLVPAVEGFEGQSVVILEVVEEQDDATALSRIAVYLAETGQLELASKAGAALRRFPADLGALLAQAQVENACGENDSFAKTVEQLVRRISGGADRDLEWDQRVGLAVVLAQAQRLDLARPRLRQCLADIDEGKLHSISTILLYRLQLLRKALKMEIKDPALRALSLDLLPSEMRARVE